jgi:hypothetical protein
LCVLGATALVHAQTPAPSALTGTNVLFGRVVDIGTDAAVGGAIVTLDGYVDLIALRAAALDRTPQAPTARHLMTTGDGYFFFRGLPAGRYSIATRAFGYLNIDYPPRVVEISDSDRPVSVTLRIWKHATIAGRVIDERGEPVAGIPVAALRRITVGGRLVLRRETAEAETDDRGEYRLAQVSPGSYVVAALSSTTSLPASLTEDLHASTSNRSLSSALRSELIASGFRLQTNEGHRMGDFILQRFGPPLPLSPDGQALAYATTLHPGTVNPRDAAVITLGSGESRMGVDVPIRFSPTVRVSGIASGPDGPITHLTVRLLPPNGADLADLEPAGAATAVTNASGAFAFLAVSPGEYVLRTALVSGSDSTGEGLSLWAAQPLTVGDTDLAGLAVTLQPGVRVSGRVEFRDAPGMVPSAPERIVVGLRPIGSQLWRSLPGVVRPDGTFVTVGDPPGRYVLHTASASGRVWEATSIGGKPVADEIIELDAGDVTDVVLTFSRETTRVSGSIADASGAPDAETEVIVFPADSASWREGIFDNRRLRGARASSAAAFEISGLAPGEYYIAAIGTRVAMGWLDPTFLERLIPAATRFTLGAGEDKTLSLRTLTLPNR